jgi:quercetin dioxygenase-like cupin family protein
MTGHPGAIVLPPGEGQTVTVLGDQYAYKAIGADTGGAYGLLETMAAPGSAVPAHIHHTEDEAFYVLEGELTIRIGGERRKAPTGTFAFIPRGSIHAVTNAGSRSARALVILSPAGFERAFAEMAQVMPRADTPPDMERLTAIAEKYHLEITEPPRGASRGG